MKQSADYRNEMGWTFDTLHYHIARLTEEREKRHVQALEYTEKALVVAREALEEYKKNSNEWRATMKDREANFLTKTEHTKDIDSVLKGIENLKEIVNKSEGARVGAKETKEDNKATWAAVVSVGMFLGMLVFELLKLSR